MVTIITSIFLEVCYNIKLTAVIGKARPRGFCFYFLLQQPSTWKPMQQFCEDMILIQTMNKTNIEMSTEQILVHRELIMRLTYFEFRLSHDSHKSVRLVARFGLDAHEQRFVRASPWLVLLCQCTATKKSIHNWSGGSLGKGPHYIYLKNQDKSTLQSKRSSSYNQTIFL